MPTQDNQNPMSNKEQDLDRAIDDLFDDVKSGLIKRAFRIEVKHLLKTTAKKAERDILFQVIMNTNNPEQAGIKAQNMWADLKAQSGEDK